MTLDVARHDVSAEREKQAMSSTDELSGRGSERLRASMVTPVIADAALYVLNRGGRHAGHFFEPLMRAIAHADTANLELLRSVFPAWVRAYEMGHNETYGIDRLAEIAGQR